MPPGLEGPYASFERVLAEVEPAKDALTAVMPTTRLPGRSLPDALAEFDERVARARAEMPGWRRPETDAVWVACDAGLATALSRSASLREDAPDLGGFDGLIWAVERLLGPLEPFRAAAERFRSLRVATR